MPTSSKALPPGSLQRIKDALQMCNDLDNEIRMAEQAEIDTGNARKESADLRHQFTRLMHVYFPGGKE